MQLDQKFCPARVVFVPVGTDRGANRDGKHRPPVEAGVLRKIGKLQETCGWLYGKNSG